MKKVMSVFPVFIGMMLISVFAFAQNKTDDSRMQRDIEIAENVLSTMIKQQLGKRNFFPLEVHGSYLPGYGVTFRLPNEFFGNMFFIAPDGGNFNVDFFPSAPAIPDEQHRVSSYSLTYDNPDDSESGDNVKVRSKNLKKKLKTNSDSATNATNEKLLEAAKNFIADYGDLLTQLQPNEKIIITNKSEGNNKMMMWGDFKVKRNVMSVEGTKGDVTQLRQGKITRDQLMNKLRVMNNEVNDELQPDLELLSSIFNRLYSRDLSKTFFCDNNIYYERLKDYGVVYHMQVFASSQIDEDEGLFEMPTVRLREVDQQERDKKVKELYPQFESSIKEDFLEYGRTLKSLKDDEVMNFEIQLTRCRGCHIPSTLELSVKYSVLKDYSSGKISKEAALGKISMKKGAEQ
jgi:hypothetical protein